MVTHVGVLFGKLVYIHTSGLLCIIDLYSQPYKGVVSIVYIFGVYIHSQCFTSVVYEFSIYIHRHKCFMPIASVSSL